MMSSYVTVDLGATSGRVVLGRLQHGRLEVAEVHRFRNEPSGSGRKQLWDAGELFAQTVIGLRRAAAELDGAAGSIGVTAWGVDGGLLDEDNNLLAPIQHYRAASPEAAQALLDQLGAEELFARTGVLPQQINTVFRIREILDSAGSAAMSEGVRALSVAAPRPFRPSWTTALRSPSSTRRLRRGSVPAINGPLYSWHRMTRLRRW